MQMHFEWRVDSLLTRMRAVQLRSLTGASYPGFEATLACCPDP